MRGTLLLLAIVLIILILLGRGKTEECQPSKPDTIQYKSWRIIDGQKCWYVGRPGKPKSELRWVRRPVEPSVITAEVGEDTAVSSPDLGGTFLWHWCNTMTDLAAPWWRDRRTQAETWTGVLSGGL